MSALTHAMDEFSPMGTTLAALEELHGLISHEFHKP
jgi:hypothetical protein